jgi:hypothetical protein
MARLKVFIPATQFEAGGKFEAHADNKRGVQVPFVSVSPTINANFSPQFFEETQFQPESNMGYYSDLESIRQGLIVVERVSAPGTPLTDVELITIFKTNFQEL